MTTTPAFIAAAIVLAALWGPTEGRCWYIFKIPGYSAFNKIYYCLISIFYSSRSRYHFLFAAYMIIDWIVWAGVSDLDRDVRLVIKTLPSILFVYTVVRLKLTEVVAMFGLACICSFFGIYYLALIYVTNGWMIDMHQGIIIGINAIMLGAGSYGITSGVFNGSGGYADSDGIQRDKSDAQHNGEAP